MNSITPKDEQTNDYEDLVYKTLKTGTTRSESNNEANKVTSSKRAAINSLPDLMMHKPTFVKNLKLPIKKNVIIYLLLHLRI